MKSRLLESHRVVHDRLVAGVSGRGGTALHYFGEDLVAYRDAHDEPHVLEAHCKHLGAHLEHGGKVVGDGVQCPEVPPNAASA